MKKARFIPLWVSLIAAVFFTPSAAACLMMNLDWNISGVADFRTDGSSDVFSKNHATGDEVFWHMHKGVTVSEQKHEMSLDRTCDIVGVGGFNEDRRFDILLRDRATGEVRILYLGGSELTGQDTVRRIDGTSNIVGTQTLNGEGNADIILRQSTTCKTIVGPRLKLHLATGHLESLAPPPWDVTEAADFNGDGSNRSLDRFMPAIPSGEIAWKNVATGEIVVWDMRGLFRLDVVGIAARAPPAGYVAIFDVDASVNCGIGLRDVATFFCFYPLFRTSLAATTVFLSLSIRAPPMSVLRSSFFQKKFIPPTWLSQTENGPSQLCGMWRLTVTILHYYGIFLRHRIVTSRSSGSWACAYTIFFGRKLLSSNPAYEVVTKVGEGLDAIRSVQPSNLTLL